MDDFGSLGNGANYFAVQSELQEFAIRLKNRYRLGNIFDEVLFDKGIALTPGLQTIITIIFIEFAQSQFKRHEMGSFDSSYDVDKDEFRKSFEILVEDMKSNPSIRDSDTSLKSGGVSYPLRSAFSFLNSVKNRWCRIPPFCE